MKREGAVLGVYPSLGVTIQLQDGTKHYLLCGKCEQYLGVAENHLAQICRMTELKQGSLTLTQGPGLQGVNRNLIMRAVLGILLKAHFAPSAPYRKVHLKKAELNQFRSRLLRDDYDSPMMSLIAFKWVSVVKEGVNPRALVFAELTQIMGARTFDLLIGGWSFTLIMSLAQLVHYRKRDLALPYWKLKEDSWWPIMLGEISEHRYFDQLAEDDIRDRPDPWSKWPLTRACPCGLDENRSFADCCRYTWCWLPTLTP